MNKKIYITELIILIFIIMFKVLIINQIPNYSNLINIIFWILFTTLLIITGGIPRNKNYFKKSSIKIVLIVLLFYFLISYLLGLLLGFNKTFYAHDLENLLKNIIPVVLIIISIETARYLILKHQISKLQVIMLTLEFIILNIIVKINGYHFDSAKQIFITVSTIILPLIASEILCTYISYYIGLFPTLIYKLIISLFIFIVPFVPNLGDYLIAIFGLLVPYMIFIQIKRNLQYKEKYNLYAKKYLKKFLSIFLSIIIFIVIILISGLFKYQMMAIATGSMEPVYFRGDAVIFEKIKANQIKKNDILVFKTSSGIITHRVMEIKTTNGEYSFKTKGDNNDNYDNLKITDKEVIGVVRGIVKYIGYPTVWFNEIIENKK